MKAKERALLERSPIPAATLEMQAATDVLTRIREHFEALEAAR